MPASVWSSDDAFDEVDASGQEEFYDDYDDNEDDAELQKGANPANLLVLFFPGQC